MNRTLQRFREQLGAFKQTVDHLALVFDNSTYGLVTTAIDHLETKLSSAEPPGSVIQLVQNINNLFKHLDKIHYTAGGNYIADGFDRIAVELIRDLTPEEPAHQKVT